MPIIKTASFYPVLTSLYSVFNQFWENWSQKSEEQDDIYIQHSTIISYQHWSVSQVLLEYPEKPDIAAAAAAPADDVMVEAEP